MIIDHIGLTVGDYGESKQFFCRALAPLGIELIVEVEEKAIAYRFHRRQPRSSQGILCNRPRCRGNRQRTSGNSSHIPPRLFRRLCPGSGRPQCGSSLSPA
jgi:hypothetical protein